MRHIFDPKRGRRGVMSTTPSVRSTVPLTVLENGCNGIGDALCYAWVLASIRAAGRPITIRTHRWPEIFATFGQADATSPSARTRIGVHPPKGMGGDAPWVRHWLDSFGHWDIPIVRPTYTPNPADTSWASEFWAARDQATGSAKRILIFPEVIYKSREWPESSFASLAWCLHNDGQNVLVLGTKDSSGGNPYPYKMWGLPFGKWCALVAQSHLVIGNDSGPAHVAGTLNIPTLALTGPSPTAQFFSHLKSVEPLHVDPKRLSCVGCAWVGGNGYREACNTRCDALGLLLPFEVFSRASELLGTKPDDLCRRRSLGGRSVLLRWTYPIDQTIFDDLVRDNCYRLSFDTLPKNILDVGGHVGIFSALARTRRPNASIVSVEPHPANLEVLRKNAETFDFRVIDGAVAYRPGRLVSRITSDPNSNTGGSWMGGDGLEVPLVTLRHICHEVGWNQIDLLKLDCEGAEEQILSGPDMDLVREVVGEWHCRASFMRIVEPLVQKGWTFEIWKDGELGLFHLKAPAGGTLQP